jgi:preprotein translocase subunit SecA
MFSFFRRKDSAPKVNDIVFATKAAKWNGIKEAINQTPKPVLIAWFEDSAEELQQYFHQQQLNEEVINYRQIHAGSLHNNSVIFIEHYPLASKENELFISLKDKKITVYSSLDESLFKIFGGENISALLSRMGLNENEAISHPMITRSIRNAQEKLQQKLITEQSASSMEEWMRKNVAQATY